MDLDTWYAKVEGLDEKRNKAKATLKIYQTRIAKAYDAMVRPRQLKEGDLVLRAATHIMRGMSAPKFSPKWEGPFVVKEVSENGYCKLIDPKSGADKGTLNMKWVKLFYP